MYTYSHIYIHICISHRNPGYPPPGHDVFDFVLRFLPIFISFKRFLCVGVDFFHFLMKIRGSVAQPGWLRASNGLAKKKIIHFICVGSDFFVFYQNLKIEGMTSLAEGSKMTFSKKERKWRPDLNYFLFNLNLLKFS